MYKKGQKGKKEVSEQKRKDKEKKVDSENDKSREEEDEEEERMEEEPEADNELEEEEVDNWGQSSLAMKALLNIGMHNLTKLRVWVKASRAAETVSS